MKKIKFWTSSCCFCRSVSVMCDWAPSHDFVMYVQRVGQQFGHHEYTQTLNSTPCKKQEPYKCQRTKFATVLLEYYGRNQCHDDMVTDMLLCCPNSLAGSAINVVLDHNTRHKTCIWYVLKFRVVFRYCGGSLSVCAKVCVCGMIASMWLLHRVLW